jgi:hypothetical protein
MSKVPEKKSSSSKWVVALLQMAVHNQKRPCYLVNRIASDSAAAYLTTGVCSSNCTWFSKILELPWNLELLQACNFVPRALSLTVSTMVCRLPSSLVE